MPNLKANHEEADTRLIFHISQQTNFHTIVVKADDTDILILLLYFNFNDSSFETKEIYMEKGHNTSATNQKRFVPVHAIGKALGKFLCDSLLAFHAITGCDTTNSFFKIGKKSAWDIFIKNSKTFQLDKFGKDNVDHSVNIARIFVLYLYRQHNCTDLNDARLKLTLYTKKSAKEIPPTEDAFRLHVLR